jgi:hypothetical protein
LISAARGTLLEELDISTALEKGEGEEEWIKFQEDEGEIQKRVGLLLPPFNATLIQILIAIAFVYDHVPLLESSFRSLGNFLTNNAARSSSPNAVEIVRVLISDGLEPN